VAAPQTLGDRIRRLRQERALSLAQVAGADFSRAFLNQVELGRSQPSTRVLRAIASRLGTQVDYLLAGSAPALEREIALERARISLARGAPARALREVARLRDAPEWPLGTDARLAEAEALLALGHAGEAEAIARRELPAIAGRQDELRRRRARSLLSHRRYHLAPGGETGAAGQGYARLAERAWRAGDASAALENYRAARILLELATVPRETRKATAARLAASARE
jgi:transcriptional regulator with XRE-family HTH domain